MIPETNNNIYGACKVLLFYIQNPNNLNRSSGGSSGGEGAILALRGSPLGIGIF